MAKIIVNNPKQVINGGAKKYYFKVKGLGGPKGDKGDKGDTGATGPQGPQGNAATVSIGSTTTLPVGYDATVTNSGSIYNAVLNFGIPQGPRGPQGATGATGAKGDKGDQGNPGPQGEKGTNATVYIGTTTTGEPGTQASVYNSGTSSNAVLNFTIPRGDVGATGATGATGPQGPAGQDGQNFTPTIVETLPTTGDQSKLYLTPKAHTTSTATGNPIEATITAQAGQLESFQLDGDTFQQSYTGKNLCDGTIYKYRYVINAQGEEIPSGDAVITNAVQVEPDTTYTASVAFGDSSVDKYLRVAIYTSDMTFISRPSSLDGGEPVTFTTPSNARYIRLSYYVPANNAQLELGSTATSFEPFVGGQPSPNPDYPQAIQTVTGEQTVEIVGKNLIDPDGLELGNIDASGNDSASRQVVRSGYIRVAAGNYTLKVNNSDNNINLWRYAIYDNSKTFVSANTPQAKSATITIANNGYIRVSFYNVPWKDLTVQEIIGSQVQLELGSTASAYAPYSKQALPINLGSIELCKLVDYQDYIWKDGEDWKVHKSVGKAELWNGTNWRRLNTVTTGECRFSVKVSNTDTPTSASSDTLVHLNSNYWPACSRIQTFQQTQGIAATGASDFSAESFIAFVDSLKTSGVDGWKAWLTANKPVVYYQSTTPTDTTITDTNLIAQLEAIRTALLQNGANTITNTATGTNLAGDMEIGYFEFNPTNRYDKFIWLDLNNNYEQIGGE